MDKSYHFETELFELKCGDKQIRLNKVINPEALFDQLLEKGTSHEDVKTERIPYWAELWPASMAMSSYLMENPSLVLNKEVLEIGCGLGLAGISAKLAGGRVLLTDYLQEAVGVAAKNWEQNFDDEPNVQIIDWNHPPHGKQFDVIIGADVLYDKTNHGPLIEFFNKMLKYGGLLLLSDPSRGAAKSFFEKLDQEDYRIKKNKITNKMSETTNVIDIYTCVRSLSS
jgi:predicted nicotinamide N-methyase